jgi:hypothetical protein
MVAGALVVGGIAFCMLALDLPPFHEPRKGNPGIPGSLDYALGSDPPGDLVRAGFFVFYGAVLGAVVRWIRCLNRQ